MSSQRKIAAKMRYSGKDVPVFVVTFVIGVKSEFVLIVHSYNVPNMQFGCLTPMNVSCLMFRDL